MNISLGPILYCWPKDKVLDFYNKVAQSNVNTVYLGETVCSRRREVKFKEYLDIAHQLQDAGKQVIISTLALVEAPSEYTELKRHVENGHFQIEANDMAGVQVAKQLGVEFVCGPTINNYNLASLNKLQSWGMKRFVMPVELSRNWLEKVIQQEPALGFEIEVFGHGHMPLAHSARCFTARHKNLQKDQCGIVCLSHPKGLLAQTQESQPLLRLNGIQTQSAAAIDLSDQISDMQALGVDYFRVSPSSLISVNIAEALQRGESVTSPFERCDGYWFDQAGFNLTQPEQPA